MQGLTGFRNMVGREEYTSPSDIQRCTELQQACQAVRCHLSVSPRYYKNYVPPPQLVQLCDPPIEIYLLTSCSAI